MKNVYICAMTALILIGFGCQKHESSESKKVSGLQIPTALELQVHQSSRQLTKSDIDDIKHTFAQRTRIDIPTHLLLADDTSKMNEFERQEFMWKEQSFKYLASPASYEFYQSLRANCAKNRVEARSEASYPLQRVKELTDLKTNDRVISETVADYTGVACALTAKGSLNYSIRAERMEPDALVSFSVSHSLSALLTNQKIANLLNSNGFAVTAKISSLNGKTDARSTNFEDVKSLVSFEVGGSYYTAKNEIPFSVKNSILSTTNSSKDIRVQTIQNFLIKMPDLDVSVDIEMISEQIGQAKAKLISEKYFVNGFAHSKKDLEDLFGTALNHDKSIENVQAILN